MSKSRVIAGLQCHKQLWWRVHEPDAEELTPAPALQAVFDQGTRIGELACEYVPGGVLIDFPYYELDKKVAATAEAVAGSAKAIYEASFMEDGVFVAVDILERAGKGWNLIEVKSTTRAKGVHVSDVAVQAHVLERAGLQIERIELMHLNRKCTFPDLSDLFARADLTEEARALFPELKSEVAAQLGMLEGPQPRVEAGDHCSAPYVCPFWERCWAEPAKHHVGTLYRLGKMRAAELEALGVETIYDLPSDYPLSPVQERQREAVRSGKLVVEPGLEEALDKISYPVAFLDFETIMPAVPVWEGCHPYDQLPAQFSCHVKDGKGRVAHHEWLAPGPGDPREALAESLLTACEEARTVLVYNISFERGRLKELREAFPRLAGPLDELIARLFDLLPVISSHVYHPDFQGSFSIKSVLPALVPELSYDDLEVAEGHTAMVLLEELILRGEGLEEEERERKRENLLRYCEMDTWAMVKLLERLEAL